jgi:hypothetical protein
MLAGLGFDGTGMENIGSINAPIADAIIERTAGSSGRSDLLLRAFVGSLLAFGGFATYTAKASPHEPRTLSCSQPVPEFRIVPLLKNGRQWSPTNDEIAGLCGCVWSKFPAGGWEQETSRKIREGKAPGWRREAFHRRFKQALHQCGI